MRTSGRPVPVHATAGLAPGTTLTGPALMQAETTTVLVGEGDRLTVDARGWLDIRLRAPDAASA